MPAKRGDAQGRDTENGGRMGVTEIPADEHARTLFELLIKLKKERPIVFRHLIGFVRSILGDK